MSGSRQSRRGRTRHHNGMRQQRKGWGESETKERRQSDRDTLGIVSCRACILHQRIHTEEKERETERGGGGANNTEQTTSAQSARGRQLVQRYSLLTLHHFHFFLKTCVVSVPRIRSCYPQIPHRPCLWLPPQWQRSICPCVSFSC